MCSEIILIEWTHISHTFVESNIKAVEKAKTSMFFICVNSRSHIFAI